MSLEVSGQSSPDGVSGDGPVRIRPKLSAQAAREVRRDTPLRRTRTCYGHLAGVAGVQLMEQLLSRRWLEAIPGGPGERRVRYAPTGVGILAFAALGVQLPKVQKSKANGQSAFGCLDWTERDQHLGGALGRALVRCLELQGNLSRNAGTREVALKKSLDQWLDGAGLQGNQPLAAPDAYARVADRDAHGTRCGR